MNIIPILHDIDRLNLILRMFYVCYVLLCYASSKVVTLQMTLSVFLLG